MATNGYRIRTDPDPFEPFHISQGFEVGDLIFLSGQASIDADGAVVGIADFDAQADQAFRNISAVLFYAGSDISKIVKVTIYLTDMSYFPRIVELRRTWFTRPYPADTIVEVRSLARPDLLLEIDVIALVHGSTVDA